MTIHWCGTGLSAIPGLRRLLEAGHDVAVWNRTTDKAREAVGDLTTNIHAFSIANLGQMLSPKDVIVSMLPGDWHVPLAELAIEHGAHFVSSSYIAPEMRTLDQKAKDSRRLPDQRGWFGSRHRPPDGACSGGGLQGLRCL